MSLICLIDTIQIASCINIILLSRFLKFLLFMRDGKAIKLRVSKIKVNVSFDLLYVHFFSQNY